MKTSASLPTFSIRNFLPLLLILTFGLGLRLAHFRDSSDSPFFTQPMVDGQAYDAAALAIANRTLTPKPFYQDPLYPYFLAGVYRLFGHNYPAVYLLQILMGCLIILLVWDMTRLLFNPTAALLAALFVAGYRPFIFYEVVIEKTALSIFLTALFLWSLVRSLRFPSSAGQTWQTRFWSFLCGLSLGLASLTRSNLLIFAPLLIAVHLALRRSKVPGSGRKFLTPQFNPPLIPALLSLLGLICVIAPVSIRNSLLAREFILTTTQAGQNFYIGNSEHNRTGQYEAPSWLRAHPQFEEQDMADYARKVAGRKLSYGETSRFYFRQALAWIKSHPAAFLRLLLRKTLLYLNNFEVPDSYDLGFLARYSFVLRLPLAGFGLAFALGFPGLVLFFRRSLAHLSLAIFFLLFSLSVIAFFVLDRYRLPVVVSLAPFAGALLVKLWQQLRQRHYRKLAARLGLVAASLIPTLYPLQGSRVTTRAQSLVNLGATYLEQNDTARAVASFLEAIQLQPDLAEAHRNLGILRLKQRREEEALKHLTLAARYDAHNPFTHYYLGMIYESHNQLDEARNAYSRSVELKPSELKFRFGLGTVLQKLGRYLEALAQYDTLLALAPDNPLVHHNRAVALFHLGRYPEAGAELETAKRLGGPVNPSFEQLLNTRLKTGN